MVRIFHREEVLANADRLQVTACHCEERSDVAIRIPAEILGKQVLLRANSWRFSYSPKVVLFVLRCRKENGLPHLVAPKSAMLSAGQRPAGEQRSLGAPLPAKGAPLRGPRHWFAMTCKRQRRFSECKDMAQGCYWERYLQTRTHRKLLHVIARSEATRQSASPQKCIT